MRRIAAAVMPELAIELARQKSPCPGPLAVIFEPDERATAELPATATLDVVSAEAHRHGIRPHQRVAEATAILAGLAIRRVTRAEVVAALGRVAEVALGLGITASISLERSPHFEASLDTVWLDVTGAAHLVGGELALAGELQDRILALGHHARVALSDGPRLAEAIARWSPEPRVVAPIRQAARILASLPLHALSVGEDATSFFLRLGVLEVRDLARLPRASTAARLGPNATEIFSLVEGYDPAPLLPYEPPSVIVDELRFDDGTERVDPLLFVLRGMTSRASARLMSRAEAATRLEITLFFDRSIAALRARDAGREAVEQLDFGFDLPSPLVREADLLRPLRTKLEATSLVAPVVGLRLVIPQIVRSPKVQLDLARDAGVSPDALPTLLAELSAEIGSERIGVLAERDAHRPEARSSLALPLAKKAKGAVTPGGLETTRLLPEPLRIGRVREGAIITVADRLYAVERVELVMRLSAVEWWTDAPASRDYARAFLVSGDTQRKHGSAPPMTMTALVYRDRSSGQYFLQGFCE
jgi:protein ImuB